MSESNIEWTDATWNVTTGCTRASRGCDHCYAVTMSHRLAGMGQSRYAGLTVLNGRGERHFNGVVRTVPEALGKPLGWRKPRRVFVNSMSDLFHPDVPFEYIDRVFAVMALCPQHTFQVLTKRPERMAEYFSLREWSEVIADMRALGQHGDDLARRFANAYAMNDLATNGNSQWPASRREKMPERWPLPNVWLGTSVEDQAAAEARIPHLLRCPAAVRFLSCEPLVGAVDLCLGDSEGKPTEAEPFRERADLLHWVIAGGESGAGARPCDLAWIRGIVGQCRESRVACFVKQLGAWPRFEVEEGEHGPREKFWKLRDRKGGDPAEWPEDLRVREWPG